jgi:hypothetical protein
VPLLLDAGNALNCGGMPLFLRHTLGVRQRVHVEPEDFELVVRQTADNLYNVNGQNVFMKLSDQGIEDEKREISSSVIHECELQIFYTLLMAKMQNPSRF